MGTDEEMPTVQVENELTSEVVRRAILKEVLSPCWSNSWSHCNNSLQTQYCCNKGCSGMSFPVLEGSLLIVNIVVALLNTAAKMLCVFSAPASSYHWNQLCNYQCRDFHWLQQLRVRPTSRCRLPASEEPTPCSGDMHHIWGAKVHGPGATFFCSPQSSFSRM